MGNITKDKASIYEEDKLIQELQSLIEKKGLQVELQDKRKNKPEEHVLRACPSCIACTCMICW